MIWSVGEACSSGVLPLEWGVEVGGAAVLQRMRELGHLQGESMETMSRERAAKGQAISHTHGARGQDPAMLVKCLSPHPVV